MRAVIISDVEARTLLERLESTRLAANDMTPGEREVVDRAHRKFHYEVVRWLQEVGADVVRR
jgi:hypothetical protein